MTFSAKQGATALMLLMVLTSACDSDRALGGDASTDTTARTIDGPSTPDSRLPDHSVQPDTRPPADSGQDAATSDGGGECSRDEDCVVFEDCCRCDAAPAGSPTASCKMACAVERCSANGLQQAAAYCRRGRCLVGEGTAAQCTTPADCKLINACLWCVVLPKDTPWPPDPADCAQGQCSAKGLGAGKADCVAGQCRLAL